MFQRCCEILAAHVSGLLPMSPEPLNHSEMRRFAILYILLTLRAQLLFASKKSPISASLRHPLQDLQSLGAKPAGTLPARHRPWLRAKNWRSPGG